MASERADILYNPFLQIQLYKYVYNIYIYIYNSYIDVGISPCTDMYTANFE